MIALPKLLQRPLVLRIDAMEALKTVVLLVNIFSALAVIVLVLLQHGKGADAGAAFGSGSAQGVFGAAGSANFLSRGTALAATIFFATCLAMGWFAAHQKSGLNFDQAQPAVQQTAPAKAAPVAPKPTAASQVLPE